MTTEEPPVPDADPSLSYESGKFQLSAQLSSIDATDNKFAVAISLATAIVAILIAAFGIRSGQSDADISQTAFVLLAVAGALYLGSLYFLIWAILTRDWKTGLKAQDAWHYAEQYRDHVRTLYWWATKNFIKSIDLNRQEIEKKRMLGNVGFALLVGELIFAIAALVVSMTS